MGLPAARARGNHVAHVGQTAFAVVGKQDGIVLGQQTA